MAHKEQIINEVLSAVTHAVGIGLSIWGLVLLILKGVKTNSVLVAITVIIYGITLICLYLFSTLFHSLYFTKVSRIFQCFDHCGINLLIAGTYTPYCLLAIRGRLGMGMLIVIWILALGGMAYHLFAKNRQQKVETLLYVLMGWMCLLGAKPLLMNLGIVSSWLLIAGGVIFTLGALVYSIRNLRFAHVIWHLLVMGGTACMFLSIYLFI